MSIAVVGTPTQASSSSANSLTISTPSGLQAGDVVVFSGTHQNQPTADWTLASGFTRTGSPFIVNDADQRGTIIAYHIVTTPGSEPASYTFSFPATGRITGSLTILRGVDTTNPIDGFPASKSTASGNVRTMPAFTVGHDNAYLWIVANNQLVSPNALAGSLSVDSAMTQISLLSSNGTTDNSTITRSILGVYGKTLGAAGTSPTPSATWTAATGASIMATSFRAAVISNTAPTASFTHSESLLTTSVNGSGSSDPDGTIASYDWDWGDGTTHGTTVTASHTYANPGTYSVKLTVTDNSGATGQVAQSVTVGFPTALVSKIVGGVKTRTMAWRISGGAKAALNHVWTVGRGVQTPSALVAKPGFVVGHMGARWDEVEGSMEGITRSLMWGVDALMLSIARTSDGKFFLLNDTKYLDRMSLGNDTGTTIDSSTLTWAQIQASYDQGSYWTKRGTSSPRRPYMLLTDFLTAYPNTGPILLDPKTIPNTYFGAILDIMDANGGPNRFVGKYYCTGIGWADAVHARNPLYRTWGYFYASEIAAGTTDLDTLSTHWDWLGLDYAGASAQWTQVLAKGKPVIGHIAKTRANYDTAISKGASGVMCEGVAEARLFA